LTISHECEIVSISEWLDVSVVYPKVRVKCHM